MKHFSFLFLLLPISISAQNVILESIVQEYETPYKPATVSLFKNNSCTASTEAKYGDLVFIDLKAGEYRIVFDAIGQSSIRKEIISVRQDQCLKIKIKLKGPCIYTYPENYVPECPQKHKDNIVPIIYGLLGGKVPKKGRRDISFTYQDFHPRGCLVSDCDPKYYCKIHRIEF